jgi:hypothetical protein
MRQHNPGVARFRETRFPHQRSEGTRGRRGLMPGPAPGSRCVVCLHPQRAAIEEADARGVSRREIARTYNLGKDSVNRHFYGNHPGLQLATEPGAAEEGVLRNHSPERTAAKHSLSSPREEGRG